MSFSVEYNENILTMIANESGNAVASLMYQEPSRMVSGCNFIWYGSKTGEVTDGEVLVLTFTVAADAPAGSYAITINCPDDETYDKDYNVIRMIEVNGSVVIK